MKKLSVVLCLSVNLLLIHGAFHPVKSYSTPDTLISQTSLLLLSNKDCNGVKNGKAALDNCGVCDDNPANDNTTCVQDCNGDWGGTAEIDNCAVCVSGNTGKTACIQDCDGVWGGDVFCVTSAGQIWMDRNLGASRAAAGVTDSEAYGDLYQWGRLADGHEKRNSSTTTTRSASDTPDHSSFIVVAQPPPEEVFTSPQDWRSPQNDNLWQGVSGTNNPCPPGFRLPTYTEWEAERLSWSPDNNADGAFASPLKLVLAGRRLPVDGSLDSVSGYGNYWSSTTMNIWSRLLTFFSNNAETLGYDRAGGLSVRCIKD